MSVTAARRTSVRGQDPAETRPSEADRRAGGDATRHRARLALLVLAALAVLAQPASVPWLYRSLNVAYEGIDAHTQWAAYLAAPAPEVLFLGGSNARMDVDAPAVAAGLSGSLGRTVSVGKLGINAAQYDFLDALTYRVLARSSRPRTIVFIVSAAQFNDHFTCPTCGGGDSLTENLWQISDPFDPGFLQRAWAVDPNRAALAYEMLAPAFSHYREAVAGVECPLVRGGRAMAAEGRLPAFSLLTTPTPCDVAPRPRMDEVMTPATEPAVAALYREAFVADYAFSARQGGYLQDMVQSARRAGVQPLVMVLPEYGLRAVAPVPNQLFDGGIRSLAGRLAVPFADLTDNLNDRPELWTDQLHLNRWGAQAFAPTLATQTIAEAGLR